MASSRAHLRWISRRNGRSAADSVPAVALKYDHWLRIRSDCPAVNWCSRSPTSSPCSCGSGRRRARGTCPCPPGSRSSAWPRPRCPHVVALRVAGALERVQEPEPVAGFVRGGLAEREPIAERAADERLVVEHDAVEFGAALVPRRERREPEIRRAVRRPHVEHARVADVRRRLRAALDARARIEVVEPRRVVGVVRTAVREREAGVEAALASAEAGVEDLDLLAEPALRSGGPRRRR